MLLQSLVQEAAVPCGGTSGYVAAESTARKQLADFRDAPERGTQGFGFGYGAAQVFCPMFRVEGFVQSGGVDVKPGVERQEKAVIVEIGDNAAALRKPGAGDPSKRSVDGASCYHVYQEKHIAPIDDTFCENGGVGWYRESPAVARDEAGNASGYILVNAIGIAEETRAAIGTRFVPGVSQFAAELLFLASELSGERHFVSHPARRFELLACGGLHDGDIPVETFYANRLAAHDEGFIGLEIRDERFFDSSQLAIAHGYGLHLVVGADHSGIHVVVASGLGVGDLEFVAVDDNFAVSSVGAKHLALTGQIGQNTFEVLPRQVCVGPCLSEKGEGFIHMPFAFNAHSEQHLRKD